MASRAGSHGGPSRVTDTARRPEPGRLAGAGALVTGGGSGIGRAVVDAFVNDGARVATLELSRARAAELRTDHGDAVAVVEGDAASADDLARAVAAVQDHAGRLDTLVTCVGVHDQRASLRAVGTEGIEAAFDECFRTNVLSVLLAVRVALPCLIASRGSVVVTLSESAFYPAGGGVLYGSTKWALRGVIAHLAHDLAPEVRVNGVAPGGTAGTRLAGLRSLGQHTTADEKEGRDEAIRAATVLDVTPEPADHAAAYVYLAGRGARVVTGTVINSDGGR